MTLAPTRVDYGFTAATEFTMTLTESPQFAHLIGRTVIYNSCQFRIVDYIADEQALILRALKSQASIQINQFGNATRRVPQTISVPVLSSDEQLLPEIIDWLKPKNRS